MKTIRRIQMQTTRLAENFLAGAWHSAFKGRGMEFEEVRPFFEGDEVRDIDWNVTARMQSPYIKRFQEERELSVMLVVDASASCLFGSGDEIKSERIAEIAAVLAFSAIKNNDKVGLLLFSDHVEKYIPPKKGSSHVLRVIRELLDFKPKGKKTDITTALKHIGAVQKKSCICFLITDLLVNFPVKQLSVIAKKHDLISIVVSDPHEKQFPKMGMVTITDLETGESKLVSSNIQKQYEQEMKQKITDHSKLLDKVGGGFISISMDQPYITPLNQFFKKRRIRH